MTLFFGNYLRTDISTSASAYVGAGTSPLFDSVPPAKTKALIVGGGLLGLSTALELAQMGCEVALIEAFAIGDGPSGRSGGQLWPGFEGALSDMIKEFGDELAVNAWCLAHEALGQIHTRASLREDRCDFRPGVLLTSKTGPQARWIEEESTVFRSSNLNFAKYVTRNEIRDQFVNTDLYLNGLLYRGDDPACHYGHLNPLKYVLHLANLCAKHGVRIIEDCRARSVRMLSDGGFVVATDKGDIQTMNLVFATGVDFLRPDGVGFALVPRVHVPVETVILATAPLPLSLVKEMIPGEACFCDASDAAMNYGSVIAAESPLGGYRLMLGGADALVKLQTALAVTRIEREMRAMFPLLDRENVRIETVWGGRCDLSRSGIPILIQPREGFYHASGFSGQGMVNTTLYAQAIAEQILRIPSNRFDILHKLNPAAFANSQCVAWIQAARALLPLAIQSYREQRVEKRIRTEDRKTP